MSRYLLDTSALLTLRDDEPGADVVAELIHKDPEMAPLNCAQLALPYKEAGARLEAGDSAP